MIMRLYQHVDKAEWERKRVENATTGLNENIFTDNVTTMKSEDFLYNGPCPTENLPWLMKDPNHTAYLPELLNEFPDAKFIFTHRPPGDIVASMAKLFLILTSVEFTPYAPGTTSKEWGMETNLRTKHYIDGLVEFTKSQYPDSPLSLQKVGSKSTRRIDMYFKNLVNDVPGAICDIYKQFYPNQPGPTKEAMMAFKTYLEKNEREKHGNQSRRSLKDFHLTKDDVIYTEYNDLFFVDNP